MGLKWTPILLALLILVVSVLMNHPWQPSENCSKSAGWSWALPEECNSSSLLEARTPEELTALSDAMRACGAAAYVGILPQPLLSELQQAITEELAPFLASRERIRAAAFPAAEHEGMLSDDHSEHLLNELLLSSGHHYRERDAGRIDLKLPWKHPFNATALVANPLIYSVLDSILGSGFELKSVHAIHALPGAPNQKWHRDAPLLFAGRGLHSPSAAGGGGVAEPSYAVNVFVTLKDFDDASDGPTEFALGSHMWQEDWQQHWESLPAGQPVATAQFHVTRGSAIISDYRTVHRGLANRKASPRPMLMLIYGRRWWRDSVNYDDDSYGGFRIIPPRAAAEGTRQSDDGEPSPLSDQIEQDDYMLYDRQAISSYTSFRGHEMVPVPPWKRRGLLAGLVGMWREREKSIHFSQ